MLTAQTLAMRLQGREYRAEITKTEDAEAKAAGLVVVFGAGDDLMEFRGAINDEVGAYEGATVALTDKGLCRNECEAEDCPAHIAAVEAARKIEAKWCPDIGISWAYSTDIPHFIFEVMEDDEVYCQGIVFALVDAAPEDSGPPQWIDDPHDIEQGRMLNPAWLKAHGLTAAKAGERPDQFAGADKMVEAAQAAAPSEPWKTSYGVRVGRDNADCIDLIFTKVAAKEFALYPNEAAHLRDLLNAASIPGFPSTHASLHGRNWNEAPA